MQELGCQQVRARTGPTKSTLMTVIDATMSFVLDERSVSALMLLTTVFGSMAATRPVKAARATEAKEKNFMMMTSG
jgi:hypothetical protein